jgi:hypothetical protein
MVIGADALSSRLLCASFNSVLICAMCAGQVDNIPARAAAAQLLCCMQSDASATLTASANRASRLVVSTVERHQRFSTGAAQPNSQHWRQIDTRI